MKKRNFLKQSAAGFFRNINNVTLAVAILVFFIFFAFGSIRYKNFFAMQTIYNILMDNSHLLIVSLAQTLVLVSGGIDLSVGALLAFNFTAAAHLLTNMQAPVFLVVLIVIGVGVLVGALNGYLIAYKGFQPFIATLSTQFLMRGACYMVSTDTIVISNPEILKLSIFKLRLPGGYVTFGVIVAAIMFVAYCFITKKSKFGRNVYAVGGNEVSADMMGIRIKRTRLQVYMLSGLTTAIASIVFAVYILSSYGLHAQTLHLDAVSSAVIGGTLTTGGVGNVVGTLFGVLTNGIIQTLITFLGTMTSGWSKITIAVLLLIFILLQRLIVAYRERNMKSRPVKSLSEEVAKQGPGTGKQSANTGADQTD